MFYSEVLLHIFCFILKQKCVINVLLLKTVDYNIV